MSNKENEITIYAKIGMPDGLQKADEREEQIQVEARLGESNHCRVRKTTKDEQVSFVYTFKIPVKEHGSDVQSRKEHNLPVSEEFFNDFIKAADKIQTKTRFFFKTQKLTLSFNENESTRSIDIPDICYEVDVFKKPDGNISQWCKIDVEVDPIMTYLEQNYPQYKNIKMALKISHLPFMPVNSFIHEKDSETHREFLDNLYATEFAIDLVKQRSEVVNE